VTRIRTTTVGQKSWKLIAQTISPTTSLLFVAQRPSTQTQGNIAKILKRLEVWWGEVEHKSSNISVTRKDGWKVTGGPIETLFRMVPFPTTYAPLSLYWRAPKNPIAFQERIN